MDFKIGEQVEVYSRVYRVKQQQIRRLTGGVVKGVYERFIRVDTGQYQECFWIDRDQMNDVVVHAGELPVFRKLQAL